jgi:hypothetical protein
MDRQTRRLFIVALVVVAIAAAIAVGLSRDGGGRPSGPSVDGVVTQVSSSGLASVTSFTLRTVDGRTLRFGLGELRNAATFPPAHLAEHVATAQPVRVWYRESQPDLEALWLEDAAAAPGSR